MFIGLHLLNLCIYFVPFKNVGFSMNKTSTHVATNAVLTIGILYFILDFNYKMQFMEIF